jgi:hypothetical protein
MSLFTTTTCPCCGKKMMPAYNPTQGEVVFCEGNCAITIAEVAHPNAIHNCAVHQRAFVWDDEHGVIEVAYYNASEMQAMANG